MERKTGLKPIASVGAKILILGSFPGKTSLELGQYYANLPNQFWRILSSIFDQGFDTPSYSRKRVLLKKHKIALWDVIESCERGGSVDSKIRNPKMNCLCKFMEEHKEIRCVLLNGRKAEKLYRRASISSPRGAYVPSSSPACTNRLAEKVTKWRRATHRAQVK